MSQDAEAVLLEIPEKNLDWVEKQAIENLKGRVATADMLAKEAKETLTLFLAAMGASLAYAIKLIEQEKTGWLFYSVGAICLYLLVLCALLVFACMKIAPIPAVYNEPINLEWGQADLSRLRAGELSSLQDRIDVASRRNDRTARRLNMLRIASILTPILFVTVAWVCSAAG